MSGDRCESLLSAVAHATSGWPAVDREELRDELVPVVVALQYGAREHRPLRAATSSPDEKPSPPPRCARPPLSLGRGHGGEGAQQAAKALPLLSDLLRSPLRDVRLRAMAALEVVLIGTGEQGLALRASLDLDSDPHLRDHEPRLTGACLAGAAGEAVAEALASALAHPSPARRKSALAGFGLALKGTAWQAATHLVAGARRSGDDMTMLLAALEALGSVFEARAAGKTLESLIQFRGAREWDKLIDAGYDPASPIAQAAEPGPGLERVRRELIDPLMRCAGNSRRRAARRLVGLSAHVTACRTSGSVPLDPAWELLADPMRKVRRAALWSLPTACEHATPNVRDGLADDLRRRSGAGTWQRACAALCLGALGVPVAPASLPVEGQSLVPPLAAGAELLAACRLAAGSSDDRLADIAIALVDSLETAGLAALGLGLLHQGARNAESCDLLLRWSARRKTPRLRAAAAVAVGLVQSGAEPVEALASLMPALTDQDPLVRRAAVLGLVAAVFPEASVRGILLSGCVSALPLVGLSYAP